MENPPREHQLPRSSSRSSWRPEAAGAQSSSCVQERRRRSSSRPRRVLPVLTGGEKRKAKPTPHSFPLRASATSKRALGLRPTEKRRVKHRKEGGEKTEREREWWPASVIRSAVRDVIDREGDRAASTYQPIPVCGPTSHITKRSDSVTASTECSSYVRVSIRCIIYAIHPSLTRRDFV